MTFVFGITIVLYVDLERDYKSVFLDLNSINYLVLRGTLTICIPVLLYPHARKSASNVYYVLPRVRQISSCRCATEGFHVHLLSDFSCTQYS